MTDDVFFEELAARLSEVLPAGMSVRAIQPGAAGSMVLGAPLFVNAMAGGGLLFQINEVPDSGMPNLHPGPLSVEDRRNIARTALEQVQKWVMEETKERWPDSGRFTNPHAEFEGGQLQLWYGERPTHSVELRPLDLDGS